MAADGRFAASWYSSDSAMGGLVSKPSSYANGVIRKWLWSGFAGRNQPVINLRGNLAGYTCCFASEHDVCAANRDTTVKYGHRTKVRRHH